ncbi:MAG: rRNA maturation RNase YbeY [Phycisphaerae bacterium]|jgi:probable rRNA maturation factor
MSSRRLTIEVDWRVRGDSSVAAVLRRAARHAAASERFRSGELAIVVVGRRAMARLHERHRGQRSATDVLTFDLGTDRRRRLIEGDIVVCADVAARRARGGAGARSRRALRAELALYVVHGVLHLAGYDDHDPAGFRRMHAREDALLAELGLGRVFAEGAGVRGNG